MTLIHEAPKFAVAYTLLYFSVVSPSGVTVAWLLSRGATAAQNAWLRSAVQLAGFVGTAVAPYIIDAKGLQGAAPVAQGGQTFFVIIACFACIKFRITFF